MLKITALITLLLTGVLIFSLVMLAIYSKLCHPPGLLNGRLLKCPSRPNCVCSELGTDHAHFIEPVILADPTEKSLVQDLITIIKTSGGSVTITKENYIAATFRSRWFGFIDDVEIRIDPQNHRLHIRSASRVGYSDGGVNRNRAERLISQIKNSLHD